MSEPRRCGAYLGETLAGWPLPLCAVQTIYSINRGTASPQFWGEALAGLTGDAPKRWALSAECDDLCGLPATLAGWGSEHVAVGATVAFGERPCVVLAPDHQAYARLCQLISWRNETPEAWERWRSDRGAGIDCTGLVALVDDLDAIARLREVGAEAYWRWDLSPGIVPPGVAVAAAPILRHLTPEGLETESLLHGIRRWHGEELLSEQRGGCLTDLVAMREAYRGHEAAIERGRELLARCSYVPGGMTHLPPSHAADPDGELRLLAEEGLRRRYASDQHAAARERLDRELAVITHKRFAGYILTVYDLAKDRRTCGRGSAASSLVCYCLGLTNVCPLRYRLVFERFLSDERIDPPDIDIDFAWDERDEVIATAFSRYGRAHVAMVSTHLHYRPASALHAAAKAHGLGDDDIAHVRQKVRVHERYGRPLDLGGAWPRILAQAERIANAPRHYGLHPGGIVITEPPIRDLVPVHLAAKEIDGARIPAIAWEKDGAEELGLVKIDLLGNRSLAVVRDSLRDLSEDGVTYNESMWKPEDDPAVKRLINTGNTIGCFYIESPAMRLLNAKDGDVDFDRLVVNSSVIRPAGNSWINVYLERLHEFRRTGKQKSEWYPHPCLQELLSDTYGVLAYQEDVMLVCRHLAGFDTAGANAVRKALGKSDTTERLGELSADFFRGCLSRGVDEAVATQVWAQITSFAGYSFTKAHSASYARVSFECAYLKIHHPAYFMAGVIANEGGFYSSSTYIEEARRFGVAIRPPCVLLSAVRSKREGAGAIRLGMHLVPSLARDAMRRIIAARPFLGMRDLIERAELTVRDVEALLEAGAFDALTPSLTTPQRYWLAREILRNRPRVKRGSNQLDLFDESRHDPTPPPLPDIDRRTLARHRYSRLRFCAAHHPLLLWDLPPRRWTTVDVRAANDRKWIELIGMVVTSKQVVAYVKNVPEARSQKPEAESGKPKAERRAQSLREDVHPEAMSFVSLQDERGIAECVWFPRTYRDFGIALEHDGPIRVQGQISVEYNVATLIVARAEAF